MRDAIATLLISVTIALLPLYKRVSSLDFSRTSKDNLLMLLFGVIMVLFTNPKRSFPVIGWVLVAIAFFLTVVNQYNVISINVMFQSFYISFALFGFVKIYECFDLKFTELVLNGMCIGALIQSVFVLFSSFGINLDMHIIKLFNPNVDMIGSRPGFWSAVGTLGNPNLLAGYLAICLPAFFRKKWIYLAVLPLTFLFSSKAMMGIGAFLGGSAFYLLKDHIKVKWLFFPAIAAMILVYFTGLNGMDSGRFAIWAGLIEKYDIQALIGYGPGWFPDQRMALEDSRVVQEHSAYFSIVSVFGIFGLITVLTIIYKALQSTNKIFAAILFTIFLNGYGHFSLHQSTMVIIIVTVIAICLIKEEKNGIMERRSS